MNGFEHSSESDFERAVLARDAQRCVMCGSAATDVHFIMDRKLWDDGGAHLSNAAALCRDHFVAAQATLLTVENVRRAAKIDDVCLPPQLYSSQQYDKWGNLILTDGRIARGELFFDPEVQRWLAQADKVACAVHWVKYPRTFALPWSDVVGEGDRIITSLDSLRCDDVVVTEKMDGENVTLYRDFFHSRSVATSTHPSRKWIHEYWAGISQKIPEEWRVCGEYLYVKHSVYYRDLKSYFLGFSVWNSENLCLSWNDAVVFMRRLGIESVPVLYRGSFDERAIHGSWTEKAVPESEGYVVRRADAISYRSFRHCAGKYIRKGYAQSEPVRNNSLFGVPILTNLKMQTADSTLDGESTDNATAVTLSNRQKLLLEPENLPGASKAEYLCIDLGYTFTRFAVWTGNTFVHVERVKTIDTRRDYGIDAPARLRAWLGWLKLVVEKIRSRRPQVSRIGLCFPGVVAADGTIWRSNSIWGNSEVDLAPARLSSELGLPVSVLNDISTAAVRYGEDPALDGAQTVAVVSISSGIGAKIYDRVARRVVLERRGRNGEIGLAVVDDGPGALANANGRLVGTLGNYASGVGFAQMLRRAAMHDDRLGFCDSRLSTYIMARAETIENIGYNSLNELAVHSIKEGDRFAEDVLTKSIHYLAKALHIVVLFDAPDLIVLTGGFANSLGEIYREKLCSALGQNLKLLYEPEDIEAMVRMGAADDMDNLIGLVSWMAREPRSSAETVGNAAAE